MTLSLKNQVALITGAGSGIGLATAHALASEGIRLVLSGRTVSKLEKLANDLKQTLPEADVLILPADVSNPTQVNTLVTQALEKFQRIDILINNAGVAGKTALLQEIPTEEVHRIIDTNLKGAIFVMQAVLLHAMVPRQAGTIININSVSGKTAFPFWSLYDASKFGLRAITEAVAEEQRSNNIKVTSIYPGAVDTPLWETVELDHEPQREGMLDSQTIADTVLYILRQPKKAFIPEITLEPLQPAL